MKAGLVLIAVGCAALSTHALGQDRVQQQQQQQFQAEQNRLGYQQQQSQPQNSAQGPFRFSPYIPYMHSAFAATDSGKEWGVGFSEHTDIDAQEDALRECEKVAKDKKCLIRLTGGQRPTAIVVEYLVDDDTDEVHNWFFKSSDAGVEDALRLAMSDCLSDRYTGSPHRCVEVVTWNAPPLSRSR
ncbi:hypothetical protein [Brevundimonas sp. SORGH_AS_0993]|uniref:hypothetical protein n=1 Tax=Brevundimonas sp. SORGH_AS_0993 TaxID=3041794 RepID=UPI002783BFEE|nr:hypothetical protein [Brevundimonas sp. SORGH_AS_0993]MDQ1155153.1 hypothetical protein [Brevundimonas sp. SORGH_AS_0993]